MYKTISAQEAKKQMEEGNPITIIDVRTQEEYESGHIKDAINIPLETIGKSRTEMLPDQEARIMVYCRSGVRSKRAAKQLIENGYTDVIDFGGINDWSYGTVID